MVQSRDADAFEPSAALAVLGVIVDQRLGLQLPSAASAWEAAWIACMTDRPSWTTSAQQQFTDVLKELSGVVRPPRARRPLFEPMVRLGQESILEASPGIEPGCKDLQSSA